MDLASATVRGGLRRHGLISSEPSEIMMPACQYRPTQKVVGPARCSESDTPLLKPEMIAPITITTITPMATPRMVRAARALEVLMDSSAMPTPSSIWAMAYSCRRAVMGSSFDAREAGCVFNDTATTEPSSTPTATDQGATCAARGVKA